MPDWNKTRWYCTCGHRSFNAEEHTAHQRGLVSCGIRVVTRPRTPAEMESVYQIGKASELFIHGLRASEKRREMRSESDTTSRTK